MMRLAALEKPDSIRRKTRRRTASTCRAIFVYSRRILLAGLFVVSCASRAEEVGAKPFRLGYFPNITHAQALYGRATGQFEKTMGVAIEWVSLNAGPSAIEALFVDAIDAAFIGPSPTINGYVKSRGEKFVVVAGAASGGAGLIVRRDSGIEGEGDFDGRIIATPQLGNTQDLAARAWFLDKGYRLKEKGGTVALIPLSNPDQLTMFKKKQIDGAWTVEPWLSRLQFEGGGRLFLEEKALWPQGRYVTTHLIVSKRCLAENRDLITKLLTAHVAITRQINSDKAAAAKILNEQLKKETGKGLDEDVLASALGRVELTWDPIAASLRKSAAIARRVGFLKTEPRLDGIYSLNLLNEVLRENKLPEVDDSSN